MTLNEEGFPYKASCGFGVTLSNWSWCYCRTKSCTNGDGIKPWTEFHQCLSTWHLWAFKLHPWKMHTKKISVFSVFPVIPSFKAVGGKLAYSWRALTNSKAFCSPGWLGQVTSSNPRFNSILLGKNPTKHPPNLKPCKTHKISGDLSVSPGSFLQIEGTMVTSSDILSIHRSEWKTWTHWCVSRSMRLWVNNQISYVIFWKKCFN